MLFNNITTKPTYQRIVRDEVSKVPPRICIKTEALVKMKAYVDNCDKEVAWLCIVDSFDDDTYVVEDTVLFKQEVSATTADICEVAMNDYASNLIATGQIELYNKIRGWGHSHVNMTVYASGTDESTFKDFYMPCEFFIRIICNKKGELKLDFVDCVKEIRFDNVEWEELMSEEQRQLSDLINKFNEEFIKVADIITTGIKEEIKEKVLEYKPPIVIPDWKIKEEERKAALEKEKEKEKKLDKYYDSDWVNRVIYTESMAQLYFDEEEIVELAKCKNVWELKNKLKSNDLFDDFEQVDWQALFSDIEDDYLDLISYM